MEILDSPENHIYNFKRLKTRSNVYGELHTTYTGLCSPTGQDLHHIRDDGEPFEMNYKDCSRLEVVLLLVTTRCD